MEGAACCLQRTEAAVWKTLYNRGVSAGDISTTTADRLAQSGWAQLSSRASRSNAASRREVGARRAGIESVKRRETKKNSVIKLRPKRRSGQRAMKESETKATRQ